MVLQNFQVLINLYLQEFKVITSFLQVFFTLPIRTLDSINMSEGFIFQTGTTLVELTRAKLLFRHLGQFSNQFGNSESSCMSQPLDPLTDTSLSLISDMASAVFHRAEVLLV